MKAYRVDFWDSFDRDWAGAGREFDDLNEAKAVCDQMQSGLAQGNKSSGEFYAVIDQRSNTLVHREVKLPIPADGDHLQTK